MNFETIARKALDLLAADGGASVEVVTGQPAPAEGYMVATPDSDERVYRHLDVETLVAYMEGFEWTEGRYLGLWTEDGLVYVDVSERVIDPDAAIEQARALGELAIFDLANGATVYVN